MLVSKDFFMLFFQLQQQQQTQQAIGLQAMQAQQPLVNTVYIFHIYIEVSLQYKQKKNIYFRIGILNHTPL